MATPRQRLRRRIGVVAALVAAAAPAILEATAARPDVTLDPRARTEPAPRPKDRPTVAPWGPWTPAEWTVHRDAEAVEIHAMGGGKYYRPTAPAGPRVELLIQGRTLERSPLVVLKAGDRVDLQLLMGDPYHGAVEALDMLVTGTEFSIGPELELRVDLTAASASAVLRAVEIREGMLPYTFHPGHPAGHVRVRPARTG